MQIRVLKYLEGMDKDTKVATHACTDPGMDNFFQTQVLDPLPSLFLGH